MNTKTNRVVPYFEPETRFEAPIAMAPFRVTQETEFEKLKGRLLKNLLTEKTDPELNAPLRRAANEAAGLAWLTPFPLLFFPALLDEKATVAARHASKQREIQWASPRFPEEAVA